jgi:hypothetical protein
LCPEGVIGLFPHLFLDFGRCFFEQDPESVGRLLPFYGIFVKPATDGLSHHWLACFLAESVGNAFHGSVVGVCPEANRGKSLIGHKGVGFGSHRWGEGDAVDFGASSSNLVTQISERLGILSNPTANKRHGAFQNLATISSDLKVMEVNSLNASTLTLCPIKSFLKGGFVCGLATAGYDLHTGEPWGGSSGVASRKGTNCVLLSNRQIC